MPDDEMPASPAPASSSSPTDTDVAQNWFDEWSNGIEERIGHLEQAITHVAQSQMGAAEHGGHGTGESGGAASTHANAQGQDGIPSHAGQAGLSGGQAPTGQPKPERAPVAGHWYFKRIWGGR